MTKLLSFLNFGPITNYANMEWYMGAILRFSSMKMRLHWNKELKKGRSERFKTLPSSQLNNDETLHLIMKNLHEQIIID
jgi:hypothetical protein